ncbi:MAG TPA: hypothetical protein VIR78_00970 [Malonomonas sp.]
MTRIVLAIIVLSAALLYLFSLGWFGNRFISYARENTELSLETRQIQPLVLGEPLTLELQGGGFDRSTRVQLQLDINNQDSIVGTFPLEGVANDMLLVDDQLFLATTQEGLQVFDISNPTEPEYLRTYLPRVSVLDIEKSGSQYILSCASQGIFILEASKENRLKEVRRLYTSGIAIKSRVFDNFLYVAAGNKGLMVYDLGNPEEDRPITVVDTGGLLLGLEIYQDRLYLATRSVGIQVYQIHEQGKLRSLGQFAEGKMVRDLKRDQDKLYLIENSGVSLYQLGPALPELLTEEVFSGNAQDLHFVDETLYVADSRTGLKRLTQQLGGGYASDGFIDVGGIPRAMASRGHYLYVAASNSGLKVVDKRSILPRQVAVVLNTSNSITDLYVRNDRLYAADWKGGLLSTRLNLQDAPVDQLTNDESMALVADGDLLYVAKKTHGVEVFSMADPSAPVSIASFSRLGDVGSLSRVDNFLVLAKGAAGLVLVDVSDMNNPLITDRLDDVHAVKIEVDNGLFYVAADQAGVIILGISEQGRFEPLGKIVPPFPLDGFSAAQQVLVRKGIAYIANGSGGLLIADVRNPRKVKILSSIALPGIASSLTLDGSRVYVSCRKSGLQIVEVSDPKQPQLETSIVMYGLSSGVQIVDGTIYLGNGLNGVTAIPVPQQIKDVKVLSAEMLRVRVPSPKLPGRYRLQVSNKKQTAALSGVLQYQTVQNL